jgi:hypothetical protein
MIAPHSRFSPLLHLICTLTAFSKHRWLCLLRLFDAYPCGRIVSVVQVRMPPSHAFPNVNPRFDRFNPEHTANLPDLDLSSIDWSNPWEGLRALGVGGPGSNIPIPKSISADQTKKEAKQHSLQIFKDFELLRAILDRHESTIYKRWMKKTVKQKHVILLSAWPNMATTHRPDFQAFKKETEQQRDAGQSTVRRICGHISISKTSPSLRPSRSCFSRGLAIHRVLSCLQISKLSTSELSLRPS